MRCKEKGITHIVCKDFVAVTKIHLFESWDAAQSYEAAKQQCTRIQKKPAIGESTFETKLK